MVYPAVYRSRRWEGEVVVDGGKWVPFIPLNID